MCSVVTSLEDKLICAPAGGAGGYYVDAAGTVVQCGAGTWSPAGEVSTTTCAACTSQAECATDGTTCSAVTGLEDKLICAIAGTTAGLSAEEQEDDDTVSNDEALLIIVLIAATCSCVCFVLALIFCKRRKHAGEEGQEVTILQVKPPEAQVGVEREFLAR
jgi:hypothetical protein